MYQASEDATVPQKRGVTQWAEALEESVVDTINELSDLSIELNQQSDKLSSIISSVNSKLGKLNLGIEVWLERNPLEAEGYRDTHDDEGHRIDRYREVTLLGYCKVEDEWQLAVKAAIFQTETGRWGGEYEETVNPVSPTSLLKASRNLRSKAMSLLPELLDILKARAVSLLQGIEKAEEAAERL